MPLKEYEVMLSYCLNYYFKKLCNIFNEVIYKLLIFYKTCSYKGYKS